MSEHVLNSPETSRGDCRLLCPFGNGRDLGGLFWCEVHRGRAEGPHQALDDVHHAGCAEDSAEEEEDLGGGLQFGGCFVECAKGAMGGAIVDDIVVVVGVGGDVLWNLWLVMELPNTDFHVIDRRCFATKPLLLSSFLHRFHNTAINNGTNHCLAAA